MSDDGAVHMLEAIMAAVMIIAMLAYMNANVQAPASGGYDSLRPLSGDVLDVLMYRSNTVADPGLAHVVSSPEEWNSDAAVMGESIRAMLPDGTHYYLRSPYGELGEMPPPFVKSYARPFAVYCESEGRVEECELVLWR
jgi:hypothetical protein